MSPIAPAQPYPPTNDLVAVGWIADNVAGISADMVATALPRELSSWAAAGFVVATTVTGVPDVDVPVRHPLMQIDCYAVTLDANGAPSKKPPIGKAARLAELIRNATEDGQAHGKLVTLPAAYSGARVLAAYPQTEPSRVPDPAGYARVTFDLQIDWARA